MPFPSLTHSKRRFGTLFIVLVLAGPGAGFAAPDKDPRFSVNLGWFLTNWGTSGSINGMSPGSNVNFEDVLALDQSKNVFRFDAEYRIADRHRLDLTYFDIDRRGTATTVNDIMRGDQTFPAGTQINTRVDISFFQLSYSYSFLVRERGSLGAVIGIHMADMRFHLDAPSISTSRSDSLSTPLPVIGLRGEYELSSMLIGRVLIEAFAIEVDDVSGTLLSNYVSLDYQLFQKTALGVAYNWVELDINSTGSSYDGDIKMEYEGPVLYLKFDF